MIVDAHGDEVLADAVIEPGVDRDLELGADAIGGGHQHRVLEARGLEVEQPAEAAQGGIGAGPARGLGGRGDARDQRLAGIDVDAGVLVGEAVLAAAHGCKSVLREAPPFKRAAGAAQACRPVPAASLSLAGLGLYSSGT